MMMFRKHARIFGFLLLVLMVSANAAAIVHEIDHQSHEQTEFCQVFVSAEQTKGLVCGAAVLPVALAEVGIKHFFSVAVTPVALSPSSARDPPLIS